MFEDPWEELTFRNVGYQGRMFNTVEDRFLLCLTHLHGYGSWDLVRSSIRRCDVFRFDYYLQSCSAESLGKRCEILMRSAERELIEIERKKQVLSEGAASQKSRNLAELNRERLVDLEKQIESESRRLAHVRSQMKKLNKSNEGDSALVSKSSNSNEKVSKTSSKSKASSSTSTTGRTLLRPVPDGLLPELCKLLKSAGADGISKVVTQFQVNHPTLAKRQIELKINEVAVKAKRGDDRSQLWYVKPEFEKYLDMENFDSLQSNQNETPDSPDDTVNSPSKKRKLDESEDNNSKEPRKPKKAFGFFVKAIRPDAESRLQNPDVRNSFYGTLLVDFTFYL